MLSRTAASRCRSSPSAPLVPPQDPAAPSLAAPPALRRGCQACPDLPTLLSAHRESIACEMALASACALPLLNQASPPPSGGRGAKAGWGLRDGFAQRRGLGWNPSKKGIRRSRSKSRVGPVRYLRVEPGVWGGSPSMDRPPRPVTLPRYDLGTSPAIRRPRSESRVDMRDSFAQRRGLGRETQ